MVNLENAVIILDRYKHWTIRVKNRTGKPRRYECVIWGDGRRVSASALSPLAACEAAVAKLRQQKKTAPTVPATHHRLSIVSE